MKARFFVADTAVLIRPGWHPDAVTIFNPSDKRVYLREGSADSSIGSSNYDYIVQPGGNLTVSTVADNFSAIQDAGASRNATLLLWTKDEVAPAFGGSESPPSYSGYAFGTLTLDNVTAQAIPIPVNTTPSRLILGPVESSQIRSRYDGVAPTSTVGALFSIGDVLIWDDTESIKNVRVISATGTNATVPWSLER